MHNDIYLKKLKEIFKNKSPTISRIKKLDKDLYEWILTQYPDHKNLSAKVYCIVNNYNGICKCGNIKNFNRPDRGFFEFCSIKCNFKYIKSLEKRKKTNLKLFNVEYASQSKEIQNKKKQTFLKNYGVSHPMKTEEVKERMKQTNLKRYGVTSPMKTDFIKDKVKQINLDKYGVEYSLQLKEVQEKKKQTNLDKYGVNNPSQKHYSEEIKEILFDKEKFNEFMKDKTIKLASDVLNINQSTISDYVKKYNTQYFKTRSSFELEMEDFLKEINIPFIQNTRNIIPPKELDFYLPDHNLAIECNGDYWHSLYPEGYHTNKYNLCKEKGIKLLHIWEILWNENRNEMKEFISESVK